MAPSFTVLLPVLAIIPFFLVIADDRLIQIECHNAEVPTTCIECLKSDPRSEKADKVGIAVIILGCLSNNAKALATNMTEIASGAIDTNATKILKQCSRGFYSATKDLASATLKLKSGKYDGAEHSVSRAVVSAAYCRYEIEVYKRKVVPRNMIYEMFIYEDLSEAANRIIEGL